MKTIMLRSLLPSLLISTCLLALFPVVAAGQTNTFTNSGDFFGAISASNYTETFDSIPGQTFVTTPTNFSGNGFSFTATTTNEVGNTLYGLTNAGGGDRWLTLYYPQFGLVFTNFSLNVSAIGGNFFATDDQGFFTNTPINVGVLLSDSTTFSTNYTPTSPASFLGLTFSTNVSVQSLVISNLNTPEQFPTANNLTVGVVPEPSTYALLSLATLGLAGYLIRRRRA
ncbi:MAG: PEP-CTERM sorting domain-containing protein [Chthoniobacterales bacterium]